MFDYKKGRCTLDPSEIYLYGSKKDEEGEFAVSLETETEHVIFDFGCTIKGMILKPKAVQALAEVLFSYARMLNG